MTDHLATAYTALATTGWMIARNDDETVIIAKAGRADLVMIHEPGMDDSVIAEYAATRALEADVEDIARALLPDESARSIIDALWSAPDPANDPASLVALRTLLMRHEPLRDARRVRDQHVAHSQARQSERAQARFDAMQSEA